MGFFSLLLWRPLTLNFCLCISDENTISKHLLLSGSQFIMGNKFISLFSVGVFYGFFLKVNAPLKCLNHEQLSTVVQLLNLKEFLNFLLLINLLFLFTVKSIKRKQSPIWHVDTRRNSCGSE